MKPLHMLTSTALGLSLLSAAPAAAQDPTDVTILYTASLPFVAVYVAKDEGFFEQNGINAELELVQNGSVTISGVVSGAAQVGLPTPTVVMQAIDNGLDLKVIAATNIFPDATAAGVVVGEESGIETATDLNDRKIGVPGIGGLLDVVMRKWVDENGGDSATLNVVEFSLPQTADVLRGNQMDAVATLDPFLTRAVEAGAGQHIGNYTDVISDGSAAGVLTVSGEWAEENPDAIAGLQTALDEAAAFIEENPDAAREAIAHYTTLPTEVIAGLEFPNLSDLHLTPESFIFWQEISAEQGLTSGPLDLEAMIIPYAGG